MSLSDACRYVKINELLYKERLNYGVRFGLQLEVEKEYINGIYKKFADLIGVDGAKLIFKEYRGQQITFPVEFYSKQYIYAQIIEEYDGTNLKQLASKYGYSERTVRRILKETINKSGGFQYE